MSWAFAILRDYIQVDMTKVHMDVMRPWIAKRVTELIGFEDEVVINFIYGLLEGKEVNGKEVQISLTGFMERNTGKFMKELWTLLLSAQTNSSGVPQEFLDAKAEETMKKKAEMDRIASEIQRKREKEGREIEQERNKKMDAGNIDPGIEQSSNSQLRASDTRSSEEKEERNGSRSRIRVFISPLSVDHPSSPRAVRSRSNSKSFRNSRGHSDERRRLRTLSTSPRRRGRSSSPERVDLSPPKCSLTPLRKHSPGRSLTPRRRSSYSRRLHNRSRSPSRYRMRSPLRRRSRSSRSRRSRSPIWHRSRSPVRRSRFRSRSPVQCRSPSPVRRRSPSPIRRRSPSPMYRSQSPIRRRYQRSPLTPRCGFPSPVRHRSPRPSRRSHSPVDHRSPSDQDWSPSPVRRGLSSPVRRKSPRRQRTPVRSPRERTRNRDPLHHGSHGASGEHSVGAHKRSLECQSRSDSREQNDSRRKVELSFSPKRSLGSEGEEEQSHSEERRSVASSPGSPLNGNRLKRTHSYSPSPPLKLRKNKLHHDSSEASGDDEGSNYRREVGKRKYQSPMKSSKTSDRHNSKDKSNSVNELSPDERLSGRSESDKKEVLNSGKKIEKIDPTKKPAHMVKGVVMSEREGNLPVGGGHRRVVEKNQTHLDDVKITNQDLENASDLSKKVKRNDESCSDSEESDKIPAEVGGKIKKKRSKRQGLDSDDESSYDSYEDRKEAKRKRREEKKLRKEEKHRRRERRWRKRVERLTERHKRKSVDTVSTRSDSEKYHDDNRARRPKLHRSDAYKESEQKKLEIELREKALKSLRAKKGINH